jgi:hypothetical protein
VTVFDLPDLLYDLCSKRYKALQDDFSAALICNWKKFWTVFVDDMGVFGEIERSVTQRARILDILLDVLDKPHSFGDEKSGTWKLPPQTTPGVPKKTLVLAGKHLRSKNNFRIYPIRVVFRLKRSLFSEIFRKIYKGDLKLRGCKYWPFGGVVLATAPGPYSANNFLNNDIGKFLCRRSILNF